jgi:hypothetical protein|tara:strand:+ start:306 stop:1013 length:708 start_codon:yes stop_codon:yes gene_type:complete
MASLARFLEAGAFGVLNDILSTFHSDEGYAIPNRFEVLILSPPKRGGGITTNAYAGSERGSDARAVSLRCESIQLPGRNLNTLTDSNIYGPTREIVDGVTYAEDISMIFQASSGLNERVFFEEWQKQAFDENTWNVGYYNDYVSEVHIYLLDRKDQRRYGIKLMEAFPKTIEGTELNQASNNEIIKTSVSFSFRYWTTLDANRISRPLGDLIASNLIDTVQRSINANLPRVLTKL